MIETRYRFNAQRYERELMAIIAEVEALDDLAPASLEAILRRHPKDGRGFFSKSEIIRGFRELRRSGGSAEAEIDFLDKLRMKPIRTLSGVAPVTVLTRPHPCPGQCIFCPSDVRMPKSYLSDEPGAQRAAEHQFDPYGQTHSRLLAFHNTGHSVDKVELIVLGGTWSSYPEAYRLWFLKRCFDALNDFGGDSRAAESSNDPAIDFRRLKERVDGRQPTSYNQVVTRYLESQEKARGGGGESAAAEWADLERVQRHNETAQARCVGLVLETRPDSLSAQEVLQLRRLGATKIQIGYQSLSDDVLSKNRRGHGTAASRNATRLLRQAGFKIHAHWMPNLYGSTPQRDVEDFERIFHDPDFRPDELKIYPTSLIESADLMAHYEAGRWRPYSHDELLYVLTECLRRVPEYCRLTRIIRDIPGTDIVAGNKLTNFRQIAERELRDRGIPCRDIRSREVRELEVKRQSLRLKTTEYRTATGCEAFLQYVTPEYRLAGFLRLALPEGASLIEEIRGKALIREVHVYGRVAGIGNHESGRSQHRGLGRKLIRHAFDRAHRSGFRDVAVISAVGTRAYYRSLGFTDGALYQHFSLGEQSP